MTKAEEKAAKYREQLAALTRKLEKVEKEKTPGTRVFVLYVVS